MAVIVKSTSIHEFCRVCFQASTQLTPCTTKLVYKDVSMTIIDVLNILSSPENMNAFRHYPVGICNDCSDLVQNAFVLKSTYDSTNEILEKLLFERKGKTTDEDPESEQRFQIKEEGNDINGYDVKIEANEGVDDDNENELKFEEEDDDDCGAIELLTIEMKEEAYEGKDIEREIVFEDDVDLDGQEIVYELLEDAMTVDNELDINQDIENYGPNAENDVPNTENDVPNTENDVPNTEIETGAHNLKKRKQQTNKGNYLCPICRNEFPNTIQLIRHARKHKILRRYLNKNLKIQRKPKFFANPRQTDTIFNRDEILHKCVFCTEENPVENVQDHIANHFAKGEFACNQCDRVFRKLHHLKVHVTLTHLEELPYQCENCGKQFSKKCSFDSHLLTHQKAPKDYPFKCDECDMRFASKLSLHRHGFKHTEKQSFWKYYKINKCQKCLKTFETIDELKQHRFEKCKPVTNLKKAFKGPRRTKVPSVEKDAGVWMCDLCPKTYHKLASFKTHQYYGHSDKELCELCGANVYNIKQHFAKCHLPKEGPFECHLCQKQLASKLTLVKHIRVHTGERPYACKFCDKRFKDTHTKCVHERIHVGIKKHHCRSCGKGFLEKSYMLKHERTVHKLEFDF